MAKVQKWSKVAVAMQSALAAAVTITAISQASTGVVTTSGTVPSSGAYVLIASQGMNQLNGRVVRVANPTGTTFELEGVDTTLFDTFSSGSFQVITFGTSISTATSINASGGDFDFIDTTTIHDSARTQVPGLANASSFGFDNIWDTSDAGLVAMKNASDNQSQRAFIFTFASGQIMVFNGYVGASLLPGGQAQGLVTTQTTITMFGAPTYYAI